MCRDQGGVQGKVQHGEQVRVLPRGYDLTGSSAHRDAQIRHALIRLLHWARRHHLAIAIAIEDLDFTGGTTRDKHGRRKRFRRLISGMPVARPRARLVSMAAELGIPVVAVDPSYTSRWGAQHWRQPLTTAKGRPPATTAQPWRSAGAPSGTRPAEGTSQALEALGEDGTAPCSPE